LVRLEPAHHKKKENGTGAKHEPNKQTKKEQFFDSISETNNRDTTNSTREPTTY